jgi:hypothetical protein
LAFSGGTTTTCLPVPIVAAVAGAAAAPFDWAAAGRESNASEPNNRIGYFAAIKANRPTKSDFD